MISYCLMVVPIKKILNLGVELLKASTFDTIVNATRLQFQIQPLCKTQTIH